MTAASATAVCENRASSTSMELTFSPPVMITSFFLSEIVRCPSSSTTRPEPATPWIGSRRRAEFYETIATRSPNPISRASSAQA